MGESVGEESDKLLSAVTLMSERADYTGVAIALLIFSAWATLLSCLLRLPIASIHPVLLTILTLFQTFLYTGLFVTAHDAMHGTVAPHHQRLNLWVGTIALVAYGLMSYTVLNEAHKQHHLHPASSFDPDFHDGEHKHFVCWYVRFMSQYWNLWQWLGIAAVYRGLHYFGHIPELNLMLSWVIPSLLSSVQLFYFGTYLAHREVNDAEKTTSNINSIYRPFFWSLLTCYHFGYHREHHDNPSIPWWKLPAVTKRSIQPELNLP